MNAELVIIVEETSLEYLFNLPPKFPEITKKIAEEKAANLRFAIMVGGLPKLPKIIKIIGQWQCHQH